MFPLGKVASVKLTTYLQPKLRFRMYGVIRLTSLPYMLSWRAEAHIYSTFQQTHIFQFCHYINCVFHNGKFEIQILILRVTMENVFKFTTNLN